MPSRADRARQPIKAKHRLDWQQQIRQDCLQRVHEQRERLLHQCRTQPLQQTLQSVLSDVTEQSLPEGDTEYQLTAAASNGDMPQGSARSNKSLLGHHLLSVEEHQELMAQMEAALFDESYREELEAIEAAEVQDVSDMFAMHCIVDHPPKKDHVKVLCPVCEEADLVESAFGSISCPVDHFCIQSPMQGVCASLKYVQNMLDTKLEEHRAGRCLEKPTFFVKRIGSENLYMACFECGAFEVMI